MNIKTLLWSAPLLLASMLSAQTVDGVVNSASYTPAGLPSSGIAQGSIFSVFGRNLGPASSPGLSFPLQTTLGGTSVRVTVGGQVRNAIILFTSPGQVNAILPSNTPEGTGTVQVTFGSTTSPARPITVVRSGFGSYTANQAGSGPGILYNFIGQGNEPLNRLSQTAQAGQVVTLWGTGLGPVEGDEAAGPRPGALNTSVEVYVGGTRATVNYAGRSGCCAGVDQIVFVVPAGLQGCFVPVVVKTGNIISNYATMAVGTNRSACEDKTGVNPADITTAQAQGFLRVGSITLGRFGLKLSLPGLGSFEVNTDSADASFYRYPVDSYLSRSGAITGVTTIGSCSVYSFRGAVALPEDVIKPQALDAGASLTLRGPGGDKTLTKQADGSYGNTELAGPPSIPGLPGGGQTAGYLVPGIYTVIGTGGSGANAVGAFSAQLTVPPVLTWLNETQTTTVNRAAGQDVTWSGGDPTGNVLIYGASINAATETGAAFTCVAPTSAGRFTVPGYVLLSLPPSTTTGGDTPSSLFGVGTANNPTRFQAAGLDVGNIVHTGVTLKTVTYQ